jgi:hypothetical protein
LGNELTGDTWRIELPSGAWLQVRSRMTVEDQRAVQGAVDVEIHTDGQGTNIARLPGDHQAARRAALLHRIITAWSYAEQGIPVPSQNVAGVATVDSVLNDLDDMNEVDEAIQPLMEKVNPTRSRPNSKRPSPA